MNELKSGIAESDAVVMYRMSIFPFVASFKKAG